MLDFKIKTAFISRKTRSIIILGVKLAFLPGKAPNFTSAAITLFCPSQSFHIRTAHRHTSSTSYLPRPLPSFKLTFLISHNPALPPRNRPHNQALHPPLLTLRTQHLLPRPRETPPRPAKHHTPHGLPPHPSNNHLKPPQPSPPKLHPLLHLQRQQTPRPLRQDLRSHRPPHRPHPRHTTNPKPRLEMVAHHHLPPLLRRLRHPHRRPQGSMRHHPRIPQSRSAPMGAIPSHLIQHRPFKLSKQPPL